MNYKRIYNELITDRRAKEAELIASGTYYERHHIRPRSLGGGNEPENLIALTAGDHFHAHLLLAQIHGRGMWGAVWTFAKMRTGQRDRMLIFRARRWVHVAREEFARYASEVQKGIPRPQTSGENNGMATEEARAAHAAAISTPEYREKQSKRSAERWQDPEQRARMLENINAEKIRESMKKRWEDPEYRRHMSEAHKGYVFTDEHRENLRRAMTGRKAPWLAGENSPNRRPEVRAKISASLKGHIKSEEHRRNLSKPRKNTENMVRGDRHHMKNKETRNRVSAAQKGKARPQTTGGNNGYASAVRCVETGEVFTCMKDAERAGVVSSSTNISRAIKSRGKCGGYHWEYA